MFKVTPENTNYEVKAVEHDNYRFTVVKFPDIDPSDISGNVSGHGEVELLFDVGEDIVIYHDNNLEFVGVPDTDEAIAVFIN